MAKQIISLGTTANDKTGDTLRVAFDKVNDNFTELYDGAGGGTADLGNFKISSDTLGTKAVSGNGWGGYWMYLDPAGEGYSGISIPSSNAQTDGGSLQIYHNNIDSGPLQLTTNGGTWEFKQNGKLAGPAEGELELDSNLSMNTDKGFIVEMGRFPMAIGGDDWWFDVNINRNDGYVYCFGGADEADGGSGEPLIVKFDSHGNVVWQNTYTVPTNWGMPNIITADFKDANTISVVAMTSYYDSGTDTFTDYTIYFEIQTSNGNVVSNSGYALNATDTLENWNPYLDAAQIRYNADKTQYAIVGSAFGDVSNYTISAASAISTTPGVIKVSKSAIDTAFGTTYTPYIYNNSWTIRGYGFTSTNQFTNAQVETIEGTEYYVLTTDTSVDFTTLPEGESWIIRYYDTDNAYITTGSWEKKIDYLGEQQWFSSVAFDAAGNIYAGGRSGSSEFQENTQTSLLVSFTSTGTVRWAKRIDDNTGPKNNGILDIAYGGSTDNYIYTLAVDGNNKAVIAKVTNTGTVSWIQTMDIDGGMSSVYDSKIIKCNDGTIVCAIEYNSITSNNDDFLLMKLNTDGELQWALSLGSNTDDNVDWDWGEDFLSADDNYIYLCGQRYTGDDDNAVLYAIPHDGEPSGWVGMYNVRVSTDNISFTEGSTLNTDVAITTTTLTNISEDTYITLDGDSTYETRRVYLNGGNNKLKNVAEIEFADGTTQRTSATDIPQVAVYDGNNYTLNASYRGGHIKVKGNTGSSTIYVPTHEQNPLPIGMVVTIVLDEMIDSNTVYITGNSSIDGDVYIRPVGSDVYDNRYWSIGGDNVQGLYTLMKIEKNVWILSGATINNAD